MTSGPPADLEPPPLALELARGRRLQSVWLNELGGSTWRVEPVGGVGPVHYLKVGPLGPEFDPVSDAERLDWLRRHVPVPEPLDAGNRGDWGWLETRAVEGWMVIPGPGRPSLFDGRDVDVLQGLGRALRQFHERVPVLGCPYDWSVTRRLRRCSDAGRAQLGPAPEVGDDLVVCHGDACNPNILLHADLTPAGWVDLGRAGVADRWADLAPAVLSAGWNFGDGLGVHVLDGYGIGRDLPMRQDKLDFYCALWQTPGSD